MVFGLWAWNGYAQINLTTPGATYTENFDATTGIALPTGWTSIDVANDGAAEGNAKWATYGIGINMQTPSNIAFGGTGRCMGYTYNLNGTSPANDWAIAPSMSLVTGQNYRITFKYACLSATYPEKMKVFIGSAATVAGMTTQLQDFPNINSATYADATINFTVATTGTYFIGFQAYSSADQFTLRVDDVAVTALVANDVAYSNITTTAVATNCASFTATTPINIQISNPGTANQTNVPVNYTVTRDGNAVTNGSVTVPSINSGTTASASFNLDMTIGGVYTITATTALTGDAIAGNNSGSVNILNPSTDLMADGASYSQNFETATTTLASVGWQAVDGNADAVTWTILTNANFTNQQIAPGTKGAICFRSQTVATNDWLFSNCLKLKGGKTYSVSFYRRANGGFSEKLKLSFGTTPTAAGMTTLIQDYGTFTDNTFILVTNTFTPATDGTYYLGWQNYGDAINATGGTPPATANGIIIDDVYILNPAATDLSVTTATTATVGCAFTATTPVAIGFANTGTTAFASTFTWELRNSITNAVLATSSSAVTVPSIAIGGTTTVNVNYDFSSPGTIYSLKVTLANDGSNSNNERTYIFINPRRDLSANNSTYVEDFENAALNTASWTAIDGNADNTTWGQNTTAGFAASGTRFYAGLSPATTTANDWLFSPCLTLKAGKVYNLTFKYRTTTVAQNLTVNLTSTNSNITPTIVSTIQSYPSLLSAASAYTTANLTFFVPTANGDGTYYIAFKNGSGASASNFILLDDVTITNSGVDAIPPVTPTSFAAASTVAFQADLTWTAPAVPASVTSYILERSTTAGSGFVQIATPAAAAVSYSDLGLVGGTLYYYRLTAVNQYGNSTAANAQVTVLSPPAPTLNTPTSPSVLTINLSWTDLASETGYIVERSTTAGTGFAQIGSNLAANTVTYQDQGGLSAGTTYYYRVRAIYAGGNSAPSNEVNIMPMAPPAVTGLTAVAPSNTISPLTINLNWTDVAGETGYTIERSTTSGSGFTSLATVGANVVTYTDNNSLVGGTTYFYRVIANFTLGNAVASNEASATAVNPPLPGTPSITLSGVTAVAVTVNWADVTFETTYDIERATGLNQASGFAVVGTVNANVVTFTNTGLTPNTGYTYRVVAKNTTGNATSATASTTTLNVPVPSAPSALTATYSVSNPFAINLQWNDVTGEDTYLIERSTSATGTFTQIGTTSANIVGYVDGSLTANTTYFYRVKASNISGASAPSNVASATVLAIENNAISQQTIVSPNPSEGEFSVKMPNMNIKQVTFNLVNVQGRKVFTTTRENDNANQFDFQLMNLPKGVYMLNIETNKGTAVKRIVIK